MPVVLASSGRWLPLLWNFLEPLKRLQLVGIFSLLVFVSNQLFGNSDYNVSQSMLTLVFLWRREYHQNISPRTIIDNARVLSKPAVVTR